MVLSRDSALLKHIIEETDFLLEHCSELELEEVLEDEVLKRAILRSLEIIGEAVKNLSDEFKNEHTDVDWRKISGLRDKIIHHYFGVDWNIIWDLIRNKIPDLNEKINQYHGKN
jgi:uncharacterized protein with HEPN domain